jgi:hypothetical protein
MMRLFDLSRLRFNRMLNYQHLPFLILLAVNLIIGSLVFQDYGMSWDEPLFYRYADAIGYAYSISERLSGTFDLQNAYGPSADDHKTYGPAYLLLTKRLVDGLGLFSQARQSDLWHLVNFGAFQAGLVFFYALAHRWMERWAAFSATLFFATQPFIWGHAWINPKDVPFMVFFLAAVWAGFRMVDYLSVPSPLRQKTGSRLEKPQTDWVPAFGYYSPRTARFLKLFGFSVPVFCTMVLAVVIFSQPLQAGLASLISDLYHAPHSSLGGRFFALIAPNAGEIAVEDYISKGMALFIRGRTVLVTLALVLLPAGMLAVFWPAAVQRAWKRLLGILSPLPSMPKLWVRGHSTRRAACSILLAAVCLGLLSSIRILGPLAGGLVLLYFLLRHEQRALWEIGLYGLAAGLVMYLTWPYLWEAPLARFVEVARHMSSNPQILSVLFNGVEYPSNRLPVSYLPVLLGATLTVPVWPLFLAGLAAAAVYIAAGKLDWRSFISLLLWFSLPFTYVIAQRPPMYDSYRHFIFILPPVFIIAGLAFQFARHKTGPVISSLLLLALIVPGATGIARMHPYQYTYYNELVAGVGGAFRRFETDYWLTCYREIMEQVNTSASRPAVLFVHRQPAIAREYAAPEFDVRHFDADDDATFPGSLLLLSSRTGVDMKIYPDAPELYRVGREGAIFCLIRQMQ